MNEEELKYLLASVSKGDEDAFRQLYDLTSQRLFNYLFRLAGNSQAAEDLMIDTYTEIWKSAGKFQGRSKVMTWAIGIARNLAMSEFRRSSLPECELEDEIACQPEILDNCIALQQTEILADALGRLPLKHKEVLDLIFLQEMSYEEASDVIGVPINTVKTRVFYAKDKLAGILQDMGVKKHELL